MKYQPLVLVAVLAAAGCGGGPNEPSTTYAQIGGTWSGHLQSANWAAAPISVTLSQTDGSVTGTWVSSSFDWNGTVTGTVTKTSFSGTFTISAPSESAGGLRCTGNATVNGAASSTGPTLVWTSAGFTSTCSNAPSGLTWNLQR
jgi:hypothetical protein